MKDSVKEILEEHYHQQVVNRRISQDRLDRARDEVTEFEGRVSRAEELRDAIVEQLGYTPVREREKDEVRQCTIAQH